MPEFFDRLPTLRHVLGADQRRADGTLEFDRTFLEALCARTQDMRELCDKPDGNRLLKERYTGRSALLYFTQPSSRTHTAFTRACQKLGVDVVDVRDTATSSEVKGESQLDSIRTLSSYVDVVVMREPDGGLAKRAAEHLDRTPRPRPIVNAGSGPDEHPTQAFTDIYTMWRSLKGRGGIDGKTVALVGDLKRGRTVRSLARLMTRYHDMTLLLVSPPEYGMEMDVCAQLERHRERVRYEVVDDLRAAVRRADVVYLTRVQKEHDRAGESSPGSFADFRFTREHLGLLAPDAVLMHPFPRVDELDQACDDDPRAKYWRQMRNGMWVRTALLACIFATLGKERKERRR